MHNSTHTNSVSTVALNTEFEADPVVFQRDGGAFTNSRDVAEYFNKRHDNVMSAIQTLIASEPQLGLLNFKETPYVEPSNGQTYRSYDMDRDGFTLLAMGFTGKKALKFKLRYVAQFNAMEKELKNKACEPALGFANDAAALRDYLLTYSEKVIALESKVEEMKPAVEALEQIAEAHGSLNRTEAAKHLGIAPHLLCRWMRTNGWTYRRAGSKDDIAYQSKIMAGYLEHKVTTGPKEDGTEWISTQVRVTPKGLTVLAKAFPKTARAA
ncbi:phage regulatory protein/antirepressor Ant [Brucella intermedia]|uniref:phage regulatory protein/antirepressor Ant n=1 Tax=Brucella intermedia TaxID=94625 RepID=UPI00244E9972|nr:phage regulatory protein/antirepressor Ant [Brucella intermedia]WGJ07513.1 phage regulatory protein/antirepressor Ant [Brucella intermedia]